MIIKSEHIGSTVAVRVGLWEKHVGVFFTEKTFKILDSMGIGLGVGIGFVPFWDERKFCIEYTSEDSCYHINKSVHPNQLPYRTQFEIEPETARCHIMASHAVIKDYCLEIEIKPDYSLPWPRLSDCATYQKVEVARREIKLRLKSAWNAGSKFRLSDIPAEFQVLISAQERMAIAGLRHQ